MMTASHVTFTFLTLGVLGDGEQLIRYDYRPNLEY